MGIGAILGSGRQWVSWIHIEDVVRLIEFAIGNPTMRGAVNAVSPTAVSHAQFQSALARTLRRPLWLRIPSIILRRLLGEMAQLIVDGQRVVPARAIAAGFRFQHPHLVAALRQLLDCSSLTSVASRQSVYYNGDCPVCRTEIGHYARRCEAVAAPVTFVDSSIRGDDLADYGLHWEHLKRRLYLKTANGQIVSGMAALERLWAQTPGFQWLSKAVSLPVVRPISEMLYDHVAVSALIALEKWRLQHSAGHGRILGS
jgi:predicted DCC family thiol-disulfide oxidoreductase YuxK